MSRRFAWILAALLLTTHALVQACEANVPCDKCAKDPEMSWNPENRFVSDRLSRFYSLSDLVKAAYEANDLEGATKLANEYLDLGGTYRCNWNYGNATHDANRFLGLISLKNGDGEAAAAYLLKAGKSSGSPQLNSFGPDLDLANALLKQGRVEPVKQYLRDIKLFWSMDNGQVADWLTDIEKGERPELNRFSKKPGIAQILLAWLVIAWPPLVAAGFLYSFRRRISRRWLFGITSVVSGYLAMMVAGWGTTLAMPAIIGIMDSTNASVVLTVLSVVMASSFLFSLLVILGVSRFFVAKKVAA